MSSRLGKRIVSSSGLAVVVLAVFAFLLLPAMASAQSDELPDIKPEVKCHGDLKVYTYAYSNGVQVKIPAGGGWTLYQNNNQYATEDNAGEDSGDLRTFNYIPGDKTYKVVGWTVSGWNLSYYSSDYGSWGHNTTYLTNNDTDTLKVKYTRCTGDLNVITELTGGGTLPANSGWDLTDEPSDFGGSPDSKSTGGLASGDDQSISPAVTGYYIVTGRVVTGYTITYGPRNGTLTSSSPLTLKVIYTRDTGDLNVITEVTGGGNIPDGGGWDLDNPKPDGFTGTPITKTYNGTVASGDSVIISPAVAGDYSVTGKTVTGFSITYGPKSGTLTKTTPLTLKVIYTATTGELNVITEVTGGGNIPNGGGWDLDDPKPAGFSGTPTTKTYDGSVGSGDSINISPAVNGDYSVTGKTVTGYSISYGPKSGTLTSGTPLTLKVIYTRELGEYLHVTTELFGGGTLPAGSGWDLDDPKPDGFTGTPSSKDTSGLASGDDQGISPAVTGDYSVTGRPVSGYTISYDPQSGNLGAGGELGLKVIYTENQVPKLPVNAIYWDPTVPGQVAGGTITPPGTVSVNEGGNQDFDATTLPSGYQLTGGCFFTGTGGCSMSGSTGSVTNVTAGGTLRIYVELIPGGPGELEVILLPNDVLSLGAHWHYKNSAALKTSGTVETLPAGFYDVEATDVPDWITPGARNGVQVFSGQRTTVTMIYGQEVTGALQVFITDNVDERVRKKLGAQWQPVYPPSFGIPNDPNKWYNHGDKITGLPVGELGLKFKLLNGWILPELTGAEIFANKTTKETGRYWRVLIIHKSDYNGDGTDDLAVFNKSKRQWQVASISKPAGTPAATFTLMEQKFGKSDDIPTTGDYDGDGIADLAYWRETTGEWNVRKQFKLKNFGEMHDIPVPGDYDGDGITDPAIFRPSTGEWFIYDRELEEITTVNFGGAGYVPVPGNYNADEAGMTDLGIFHIESQQWRVAFWNEKKQQWVEKKKVRVAGRKIKLKDNFGSIGNVPVMADYDGDGATDLAVYKRRPSIYDVRDQFEIQLGEHLDIPVPNDWAGLGRVIPTIFNVKKGRWISVDDLLNAKHGKGGQPLMSGR